MYSLLEASEPKLTLKASDASRDLSLPDWMEAMLKQLNRGGQMNLPINPC